MFFTYIRESLFTEVLVSGSGGEMLREVSFLSHFVFNYLIVNLIFKVCKAKSVNFKWLGWCSIQKARIAYKLALTQTRSESQ